MRTELISYDRTPSEGYGAGPGYVEKIIYKCPCGKGTIQEDHDEIPGFRDHSVEMLCEDCKKKYALDIPKGRIRQWSIVERKYLARSKWHAAFTPAGFLISDGAASAALFANLGYAGSVGCLGGQYALLGGYTFDYAEDGSPVAMYGPPPVRCVITRDPDEARLFRDFAAIHDYAAKAMGPDARVSLPLPEGLEADGTYSGQGTTVEAFIRAAASALGLDAGASGPEDDPAKAEAAAAFRRILDWMEPAGE